MRQENTRDGEKEQVLLPLERAFPRLLVLGKQQLEKPYSGAPSSP